MKKTAFLLILLILIVLGAEAALAEGLAWRDHAPPFEFLFGNHIDTHQQSTLVGSGELQGFFYIRYTGSFQGSVPEARHANCAMMPGECTVGWILRGIPMRARLLDKQPHQHPTWCVDPADVPTQPGYSHFHWLGQPLHAHDLAVGEAYDGFLLKLTARDTFFFL
ncbi:MAG: hypothetical protein GTO63_27710, partial [Anaerolineae bacterium]|nr:hypothetical protein [Anaerolineae bacterium]NIN98520.1 hypothetical protein [Anaerolineae bacterium]